MCVVSFTAVEVATEYNGNGSGESDDKRKCIRGYGTKFIVISFKSTFSSPSNLIEAVRFVKTFAAIVFI